MAAADKARVDAEVDRVLRAGLAEAIKVEPLKGLVAQGRGALATPGGKAALAEVIASVIAASALAHRPLPITSYTQDLGDITGALSGAKVKLTWEGPTDSPTKAGIEVTYAPPSGPLQGASVTASAQTGSATPGGGGGSVRYAPPSGPLQGASVSVGAKAAAGQPARGEVGVGYTAPRGPLQGMETRVTGSADTSGAAGVGVSVIIPLGSTKPKSPGRDERRAETDRLRAANQAMSEMTKTPAQREAEKREEEEIMRVWLTRPGGPAFGQLQRAADPRGEPDPDPVVAGDRVDAALSEPGQPLPADVRAGMEAAIGHDFSRVRVHHGTRAATSARAVGATAFTVGPHVVFGADRWEPASAAGRSLLAHELTHVAQQGEAAQR